ncbi:MAG: hypothetical protein AAGF95_03595 [Chloroflexota bacterium]
MSHDSANNSNLPPWLRGVPLPPRPAGTSSALMTPIVPTEGDQTPSWLQDLSDTSPTSTKEPSEESLPAWLQGDTNDSSSLDTPESLPDWLHDDSISSPVADTKETQEELPSWLSDTPKTSGTKETQEELPSWLSDTPQTLESMQETSTSRDVPQETEGVSSDGVPDWLRGFSDERLPDQSFDNSSDSDQASSSSAQLFDSSSNADEVFPSTETSPTGLASDFASQEMQVPPIPPRAESEKLGEDAVPQETEGVPDWLRDIPMDEVREVMESDVADDITVEPFTFEDATESSARTPSETTPNWLNTISDDNDTNMTSSWLDDVTSQPPSSSDDSLSDGDAPSWLNSFDDTSSSEDRGAVSPYQMGMPDQGSDDSSSTLNMDAFVADTDDKEIDDTSANTNMTNTASDVPSWLQEVEQTVPTIDNSADDMPSWLQNDVSEAPVSSDAPDWLKSNLPDATQSDESSDEPTPLSDDLPPWLQASDADTSISEPLASSSNLDTPSLDVPKTSDPSNFFRDDDTSSQSSNSTDDLPDWLKYDDGDTSVSAEQTTSADTSTASDDSLPPWLQDEPTDTTLPEWLRGASLDEPSTPTADAETVDTSKSVQETPTGALNWFEEATGTSSTEDTRRDEGAFLSGTDLPAWLSGSQQDKKSEVNPAEARSLDWLSRLGPTEDEIVTVSPTTTSSVSIAPPVIPERSSSQVAALALLDKLAADPFPDSGVVVERPSPSVWRRVGVERVLYFILLVVLLGALATPSLITTLQVPPQVPSAEPLFEQLNQLTANDVVLVGYEWDARRISELQPLEEAVLGQLIRQQVKFVLVSTDPQGTLLSYNLRYDLAAAGYRGAAEDFVLLGYKPGGELALRMMSQDFRGAFTSDFTGNDVTNSGLVNGLNTGREITELSDLSMIIVLADEPVDVQGWMEQVRPSVPEMPFAFLLPAETAPIIQPYTQQENVFYLAGKRGALAYESLFELSEERTAQIARESGQLRLGLLVFVVLFVIGAIVVSVATLFISPKRDS